MDETETPHTQELVLVPLPVASRAVLGCAAACTLWREPGWQRRGWAPPHVPAAQRHRVGQFRRGDVGILPVTISLPPL